MILFPVYKKDVSETYQIALSSISLRKATAKIHRYQLNECEYTITRETNLILDFSKYLYPHLLTFCR